MTTTSVLIRSSDRKVAAAATPNGKGVRVNNAFGLPAGKAFSCPGATPLCEKVCYAGRIEKQYKAFLNVMLSNFDALKNASYLGMVDMLSEMIQEFSDECDKKGVAKYFRIHHDGDFFSDTYAMAWATVCRLFPDVTFWVYTRTFTDTLNIIPRIVNIPNLAVYLSVDVYNKHFANDIVRDYPGVKIALLADTFAEAAEQIDGMRDTNAPGAACPELTKQIPLISSKGGACFACGLCPNGKADIRFAIKKR